VLALKYDAGNDTIFRVMNFSSQTLSNIITLLIIYSFTASLLVSSTLKKVETNQRRDDEDD
jgi:uncharacterized membrane protein